MLSLSWMPTNDPTKIIELSLVNGTILGSHVGLLSAGLGSRLLRMLVKSTTIFVVVVHMHGPCSGLRTHVSVA